MMDERAALNLDKMRRAATDAIQFVEAMSEAEFSNSLTTQMACAMCLVIIGECSARIEKRSPAFVAAHPDWPWPRIRGLRNLIVHDYDRLELPIIWRTIKESLPVLLAKIDEVGELDPQEQPKSRLPAREHD